MTTTASVSGTITLAVSGMTCGSCERHIREGLEEVPGYQSAQFDLAAGRVAVSYDPGTATPDRLARAVADTGYPAEVTTAAEESESGAAKTKSCGCCAPEQIS